MFRPCCLPLNTEEDFRFVLEMIRGMLEKYPGPEHEKAVKEFLRPLKMMISVSPFVATEYPDIYRVVML